MWSRQLSRSSSALSFSDLLPLRGHGGFLIGQWGSEGRECWPIDSDSACCTKREAAKAESYLSPPLAPHFSPLIRSLWRALAPEMQAGGFWVGLSSESYVSAEPTAFAERVD